MRKRLVILLILLLRIGSAQAVKVQVACGDWISFSAAAYEDYHFVQWSDGVTDSIRDIEVTKDMHFIAFFEPNCGEYANFPVVCEYDWLMMLNLDSINKKGYFFPPENVTWYKVTGDPDDISQDTLRDDIVMGDGYYLTIDRNFRNTGDYYAVVDVSNGADGQLCYGLMRSWLVHYAQSTSKEQGPQYAPRLVPNMVSYGQTMRIQDLNPNVVTDVILYTASGQLLRTYTGIKQASYDLLVDEMPGCYFMVVHMGDELITLRYIVVQ